MVESETLTANYVVWKLSEFCGQLVRVKTGSLDSIYYSIS